MSAKTKCDKEALCGVAEVIKCDHDGKCCIYCWLPYPSTKQEIRERKREERREDSDADSWSRANEKLDNKDRRSFNAFRLRLYVKADKLRDQVRAIEVTHPSVNANKANKALTDLMYSICSIPLFDIKKR